MAEKTTKQVLTDYMDADNHNYCPFCVTDPDDDSVEVSVYHHEDGKTTLSCLECGRVWHVIRAVTAVEFQDKLYIR